ncbi:MAG: AAA family ATPase [Acidobacteria bacterium]|nr:MAG: AAA family ATPase [Acidobacteriota bacterium]
MTEPATSPAAASLTLRVAEARVEDAGRAIARMAASDLVRIGAHPGDVVKITGRTATVARAELAGSACGPREESESAPAAAEKDARRGALASGGSLEPSVGVGPRGSEKRSPRAVENDAHHGIIQIDGTLRSNCGAGLQEQVSVTATEHAPAVAVRLSPLWNSASGAAPAMIAPERILEDLLDVPVLTGGVVRVPTFAKAVNFEVIRTIPSGPVVIGPRTDLRVVEGEATSVRAPAVSYEDIGGLEREVARVREIVELPLKHHRVFERLGILPPKGVLLYGPPGTGKTLLARAVAAESRVHFIHLNGPEIMRKFYGESEAKLREVFEEAARRAPAILFIDEIDAVAPKRAEVVGEVEKRVVAQLLSLMDGFVSRGQVIVIGATNIPEVLDPALRRPGRFDREIEIGVPNTQARLQILKIHTRAMPLAADVNLEEIAEHSHGFVGADVEALCQEVGMVALRRFLSTVRLKPDTTTTTITTTTAAASSATTFASIGGLHDVKQLLEAVIEHSHVGDDLDDLYGAFGLSPPHGILLVGPSGTGKTAIARALSGEKQLPLISIDGPQLYSKWLGESEKALREVFKKARRSAPCLLFFDAIDAIAPKVGADQQTSSGSDVYQRILSQLSREIDSLRDVKGVILLAATSRPERIEPALLRSGRFDYIVRFAKPGAADRATILRLCCRQVPLAKDVDLDAIAARTEGFTGADLESVCKKATLLAIAEYRRGTGGGSFNVRRDDFEAVIDDSAGLEPAPPAATESSRSERGQP